MMEQTPVLTVRVLTKPEKTVRGKKRDVVIVPFTGTAEGPMFTGLVSGEGVDTQKYDKEGRGLLSARYLLEGTDMTGRPCRIFIENEGSFDRGFRPLIVTDSPSLAFLEDMDARATVEPAPDGVTVRIFKGDDRT